MQIKSIRSAKPKPKPKNISGKVKHLVELNQEDIFSIEQIADKQSLKDLEGAKKGLGIMDKYHGIPKENG